MSKYGHAAQGESADGVPLTNEQMQDAAWMQSGATQAVAIVQGSRSLFRRSPVTTDAQAVSADITGDNEGLHLEKVTGDLQTFLKDIEDAVAQVNQLINLREPDGSALTPRELCRGAGRLPRSDDGGDQ